MILIQMSNFIWKNRQHCILAHFATIAMQNHIPSQNMVTPVVTTTTSERVSKQASIRRRKLALFQMLIQMPPKSPLNTIWYQRSALRGTVACPVIGNIPVVDFFTTFNSRCNIYNMQNMTNIVNIPLYANMESKIENRHIILYSFAQQ